MEQKPKRKYKSGSKVLLRSNNDYIDHGYYENELRKYKKREKRIMEKYGVPPIPKTPL